jgi:hypothetical protein
MIQCRAGAHTCNRVMVSNRLGFCARDRARQESKPLDHIHQEQDKSEHDSLPIVKELRIVIRVRTTADYGSSSSCENTLVNCAKLQRQTRQTRLTINDTILGLRSAYSIPSSSSLSRLEKRCNNMRMPLKNIQRVNLHEPSSMNKATSAP